MNIILLEKIKKLGDIGDVVKVKSGYARNFLVPNKKALYATSENKKYFEEKKTEIRTQNDKLIKDAKETAKKIQEEANLKSLEMIKRKEDQAKQKILSLEAEAIKNIKEITSRIVIESSKNYIKQKMDNKENINLISKSSNEIKSYIIK